MESLSRYYAAHKMFEDGVPLSNSFEKLGLEFHLHDSGGNWKRFSNDHPTCQVFDPEGVALAFVTLKSNGEKELMLYRNSSTDMLQLEAIACLPLLVAFNIAEEFHEEIQHQLVLPFPLELQMQQMCNINLMIVRFVIDWFCNKELGHFVAMSMVEALEVLGGMPKRDLVSWKECSMELALASGIFGDARVAMGGKADTLEAPVLERPVFDHMSMWTNVCPSNDVFDPGGLALDAYIALAAYDLYAKCSSFNPHSLTLDPLQVFYELSGRNLVIWQLKCLDGSSTYSRASNLCCASSSIRCLSTCST